MPACTVVIAFYNKPDYLALVLAGFQRQTRRDFEILIADDGSREAVVRRVHALMADSGLNVRHLWQEDRGFRKNRILNEAIRQAASDYLIFVDGDCVPHRAFVEAHLYHRAPDRVLTGRRVNLSARLTARLTPEQVRAGILERPFGRVFRDALWGGTRRWEQGVYLPPGALRRWVNRKPRGLIGCNMSMWRRDLEAVNGFDERYQAPGFGEDSDIDHRLRLAGKTVLGLSNAAVQYHLHHRELPRAEANRDLFESVKAAGVVRTPYGLVREAPAD